MNSSIFNLLWGIEQHPHLPLTLFWGVGKMLIQDSHSTQSMSVAQCPKIASVDGDCISCLFSSSGKMELNYCLST